VTKRAPELSLSGSTSSQLASAGEQGGGAEGDVQLTADGGELHRAAVKCLDALVLGS